MKLKIFIIVVILFLFHCLKFKENPLDPTTPLGYYLTYILNKNNSYVPDKIIMYNTSSLYDGDLDLDNDGNARPEIDAICVSEFNTIKGTYPGNYEYMQHVRGFISISSSDQIKDFPTIHGVPTNVPILGPDPNNIKRLIANDWNDLWTDDGGGNYIRNTLQDAIGLANYWWSGSDTNGNLGVFHCNSWNDNGSTNSGNNGSSMYQNDNWIFNGFQTCSFSYNLLCIAW